MVTSRFRTELTDVAWGIEDSYATLPNFTELGQTTSRTKCNLMRQW